MSEMKAITTHYNGYKFRSRLEARWAVFFDEGCIRYEYEPEGFKLKNGLCYLPDFYLPEENMYVEIKPPRESAWKDIEKAAAFVGNGIDTLLFLPNIPDASHVIWYFPVMYWHSVEQAVKIKWCPFIPAAPAGVVFLERGFYDPTSRQDQFVPAFKYINELHSKRFSVNMLTPKIDQAEFSYENGLCDEDRLLISAVWDKARKARFEHGEKG